MWVRWPLVASGIFASHGEAVQLDQAASEFRHVHGSREQAVSEILGNRVAHSVKGALSPVPGGTAVIHGVHLGLNGGRALGELGAEQVVQLDEPLMWRQHLAGRESFLDEGVRWWAWSYFHDVPASR